MNETDPAHKITDRPAKAARKLIENKRSPSRYRLCLRASEISLLT
jgi:hypothetical protein